jgi:hypothetical protein
MLGANLYILLNAFPMANWLKMHDVGKNDPLYKYLLRICLIRAGTSGMSSRLCNIGHALAGTATSNIINRLMYKTAAKNLV